MPVQAGRRGSPLQRRRALNRRKPRCVRPSSWALLTSPAALHPRLLRAPAQPAPSCISFTCARFLPRPPAFVSFPQPPPTRLWGLRPAQDLGRAGREPAGGAQAASAARGGSSTGGQPVEAWEPQAVGAERGPGPGSGLRGALGFHQFLGPTPDLAVTTPHCADRCYGARASTHFIPVTSIRAAGQHARLLLLPTRPTGTTLTLGVVTLHPTTACRRL